MKNLCTVENCKECTPTQPDWREEFEEKIGKWLPKIGIDIGETKQVDYIRDFIQSVANTSYEAGKVWGISEIYKKTDDENVQDMVKLAVDTFRSKVVKILEEVRKNSKFQWKENALEEAKAKVLELK